MIVVMGIDPGFAHLGVSVAEVDATSIRFKVARVITTEKNTKKANVRVASDNTDRVRCLAHELIDLVGEWDPEVICAESLSAMRNASAAAKNAMTWGAIVAIADAAGIPIVELSPQDIQRGIGGPKSPTKAQIQARMEELQPELAGLWPRGERGGTGLIEHAADSAAALVAGCRDNLIVALRKQTP